MRDPSVIRGPDGQFHMVWTTGWWDQGFGSASAAFTPAWVEGPTVLRIGDVWRIYYDEYTRKRYGAIDTRDFRTFTPAVGVAFPNGMRHGTAFAVPRAMADALER